MKQKKTICLNMIVKNESHVIRRCLDSVKHLIDTWVIVDTGSTDGTQDVIRNHLKDLTGELHERPWINFGHNRNEAMQLAFGKADYLLLIDADDRLIFSENFTLPSLIADLYSITQREGIGSTFREHDTIFLIKNLGEFQWEGVLHEFLKPKIAKKIIHHRLSGVFNEYVNDGNRSKNPNKIDEDIAVLKKAIEEDQIYRSRYLFYLARTYWSIRDYASSIPYFIQRAEMGGDPLEVYYSLLYIGLAQKYLDQSPLVFIESFCKAYLYRPSRVESIYELIRYYTDTKQFLLGYVLSKFILNTPLPKDTLFVESWVYDWGTLLYYFVCADQIGKKEEAAQALKKLLKNPRIPEKVRSGFQLDEMAKNLNGSSKKAPLPT